MHALYIEANPIFRGSNALSAVDEARLIGVPLKIEMPCDCRTGADCLRQGTACDCLIVGLPPGSENNLCGFCENDIRSLVEATPASARLICLTEQDSVVPTNLGGECYSKWDRPLICILFSDPVAPAPHRPDPMPHYSAPIVVTPQAPSLRALYVSPYDGLEWDDATGRLIPRAGGLAERAWRYRGIGGLVFDFVSSVAEGMRLAREQGAYDHIFIEGLPDRSIHYAPPEIGTFRHILNLQDPEDSYCRLVETLDFFLLRQEDPAKARRYFPALHDHFAPVLH